MDRRVILASIVLLLIAGFFSLRGEITGFATYYEGDTSNDYHEMPVLVLRYLPPDEDFLSSLSKRINGEITLDIAKNHVENLARSMIVSLEEMTVYEDNSEPYLDYFLVNEKYPDEYGIVDILDEAPYVLDDPRYCKERLDGENDCLLYYDQILGNTLDIKSDLEKVTGKDVCYYVDELNVKEVWIYSRHGHYKFNGQQFDFFDREGDYEIDLITFAVVPGEKSKHLIEEETFGVFSDNELWWKDLENYLLNCENSYVLFNYEYDGEMVNFLRDRVKQRKNLFNWIDMDLASEYFPDCNINSYSPSYPEENYTSCMKRVPGKNNGLYVDFFGRKKMINWWDYVGDFDGVLNRNGKSLILAERRRD
jgi:hypothetical protein